MHAGNQNPLLARKLLPAFGTVGFPASLRATADKGARIPGIMQDTKRLVCSSDAQSSSPFREPFFSRRGNKSACCRNDFTTAQADPVR
jgi:hypothetical protein